MKDPKADPDRRKCFSQSSYNIETTSPTIIENWWSRSGVDDKLIAIDQFITKVGRHGIKNI